MKLKVGLTIVAVAWTVLVLATWSTMELHAKIINTMSGYVVGGGLVALWYKH